MGGDVNEVAVVVLPASPYLKYQSVDRKNGLWLRENPSEALASSIGLPKAPRVQMPEALDHIQHERPVT